MFINSENVVPRSCWLHYAIVLALSFALPVTSPAQDETPAAEWSAESEEEPASPDASAEYEEWRNGSERGWVAGIVVWLLTYIVFPVSVVGIIGAAFFVAFAIVAEGKTDVARFRRGVGAGLPVVLLGFLVAFPPDAKPVISTLAGANSAWFQFIYGAAAAIFTLEIGKWLEKTSVDALAALYAMLIAAIGCFIIWSFTSGILSFLMVNVLGFLVGGALHVIFRGPMESATK